MNTSQTGINETWAHCGQLGQQEQSGSEGRLVLIETGVGLLRQRHPGSTTWWPGQVGTATGSCGKGRLGSLSRMLAERQPVPGKKTKQKERRRKVGRSAVRSGCWPASKNLPSELAQEFTIFGLLAFMHLGFYSR